MGRRAVTTISAISIIVIIVLAGIAAYGLTRPVESTGSSVTTITTTTTLTASSSSSSKALITVSVGHSVRNATSMLPIYVAVDLGIFAREGIAISDPPESVVLPGDASTTALLSSNVQFAQNGDPILIPALKGGNLVVVNYYQIGVSYGNIIARPGITNITQLNGKLVGSERPGSGTYVWVNEVLKYYHINATQVPFDSSSLRAAALLAGKVDAVATQLSDFIKLQEKGYIPIITNGGPIPGYPNAFIATTPSVISSNPQMITAFLRGLMRGVSVVMSFPNVTIPIVMRHYNLTRVEAELWYKYNLPTWTNYNTISVVQSRSDQLVPINKITNPVPVSKFVDFKFYNEVVNSGF